MTFMPFEPIDDQAIIEGYLVDASNTRGHAEALLRPESTSEISEILAHCQAQHIPLTITAQRTSTTGGPVPQGGWLLSMERMNGILDIGSETAEAEGGVILGQFQSEVEERGRFFPPDPTSRHECSLGAAIACNASGARSFVYGPIRPWVEWVEVVLPDGRVTAADRSTPVPENWPRPGWTPPRVKSAAGYFPADNLLDLFIGQEGTLGLITRARVRLIAPPGQVYSILAWFPSSAHAMGFVERARLSARSEGRLQPRCIEWYGPQAVDILRSHQPSLPEQAAIGVWCEQESGGDPPDLEAWLEALEDCGALVDDTLFADDDKGRALLADLRHAVPAGVNEQVVANGMPKVGTDCSVPDEALREMMAFYEATQLPHVTFGHVGDNHLHLNMLPRNQEELAQARRRYRDICQKAVALGGSVSAEHGIGKLKKEHLAEMVGPEILAQFQALKSHLDPAWILGRGNLLDPPEHLRAGPAGV
jgi:D-lactate dehydrogenase (cytochrome)